MVQWDGEGRVRIVREAQLALATMKIIIMQAKNELLSFV